MEPRGNHKKEKRIQQGALFHEVNDMAIEEYYQEYCLQEIRQTSTGYPPPNDYKDEFVDGVKIDGLFIQSQSDEVLIASTQGIKTRGRFATAPSAKLNDGGILKHVESGVYIRLIGDPMEAPEHAETQVASWLAEIVDRSDFQT